MQMFISDRKPLVSIMIPNYNHARYLDGCIQSALNQTYDNIEIVVLDNSSEDESVEVAQKYISQGVRVCRNAFNILNGNYKVLANSLTTGKYMMLLCADDVIEQNFIEKAVDIMEKYPTVGYVHGERDFITDDGAIVELDPFFNCSFVAPGRNMMPIYMLTTVAHPSQGVFRKETFIKIDGYDKEIDHMNADKMLWFYLSYESDYAYIREKMCRIRIGNLTETYLTQRNFQHPILCYLTIKEFVEFAKQKNLPEVIEREEKAIGNLVHEFLQNAAGLILQHDYATANKYIQFSNVLYPQIVEEPDYKLLNTMVHDQRADGAKLVKFKVDYSNKARNYCPPDNYMEIGD